ncbi:MAG: UTP--glucose-1-phosphate uridylyltransferase [Flavobacteriaceae bacterium]|nr:UTP--glucose-1-phosphate uridylyltransferase [Flavobacteriaceae bacterium]
MTLLIMAAGNGSRYGALKQFDHLGPNKEYLFEFSIYDALNNGFDHVVIITKKQFVNDVNDYLQNRLPKNIKIDVVAQNIEDLPSAINEKFDREKPWGTAHAVWAARDYIDTSFIVFNADDFYGADAFKKASSLIKKYANEKLYGLVPYSLKDTLSNHGSVSRGVCKVENGLLKKIDELTKIKIDGKSIIDLETNTPLTNEEQASMNFWICDSSFFSEIESYLIKFLNKKSNIEKGEIYIPLVIQDMIDERNVKIRLTEPSSSWFGVTYAEDKENAVQTLKDMTLNQKYPSPLWKN